IVPSTLRPDAPPQLTRRPRALLPPPLFLFAATAPPQIYTLSLHDALPIFATAVDNWGRVDALVNNAGAGAILPLSDATADRITEDRKSTRLNSSHVAISYAVFCLKKKNQHLRICLCSTAICLRSEGTYVRG